LVTDVGNLSGTVFFFRCLNDARGCSLRAPSAITTAVEGFSKFVSEIFAINRKIAKTLGLEILVMMRVSATPASKSAPPQALGQRLDEVRRQAVGILAAWPARSCPVARDGRRVPSLPQ
jgi:hypothetical protein